MKEELIKALTNVVKNHDAFVIFVSGMLFCVLVLLLLFILTALLRWILIRRKNAKGITLTAAHGDIFIAVAAIEDLIKSLGREFPGLNISRVRLLNVKNEMQLQIKAVYGNKEQSVLDFSNQFQDRILLELKDSFGIDSIQKIDLIIPGVRF